MIIIGAMIFFVVRGIWRGFLREIGSLAGVILVLKGIILTYLVIVLLTFFLPTKTPLIAKSRLAPVIVSSYQSLAGFVSARRSHRWKKKWLGQSGRTEKSAAGKSQNPL